MTYEAKDKLFSRTEYRRVIAWPERIRREAPFLETVLFPGKPSLPLRILDVGCGTGEHTRHFAERGWQAVGIDLSENMIEDAKVFEGPTSSGGSARYELRAAAEASGLPEAPFSAAICLGNTIAFVENRDELDRFFQGVAGALAPRATFLIQLLNYERIETLPVRNLAVNYRPLPEEEGEGEIVFLRIFGACGEGTIDFFPITLTLKPDEDPPVSVRSARKGKHTTWKRPVLERALAKAGFAELRFTGGMAEVPFNPGESQDLVVIAKRSAS